MSQCCRLLFPFKSCQKLCAGAMINICPLVPHSQLRAWQQRVKDATCMAGVCMPVHAGIAGKLHGAFSIMHMVSADVACEESGT